MNQINGISGDKMIFLYHNHHPYGTLCIILSIIFHRIIGGPRTPGAPFYKNLYRNVFFI